MNKQSISDLSIYYFSGTGNAKSVALWIKKTADNNNINTTIINIADLENRKNIAVPENTVVGICSPTHGFNFPPIVLNFITRFPRSNNNKVFLINTRAGLKMGKYFVPGISGIALLLSAFILLIKGYRVIGMRSIDLPSNWISIHPGIKRPVVESIFERRKSDTINFANKIIAGKRVYRAFIDILQDIIIAPVAIGYYLIGRFVFAKSFIASHDCSHCNICVEKCPVKAIKIVDNRCYWSYKCESCMQCMNNCPERAIETAHGFVIGVSFIIYNVILIWIYKITDFHDITGSFTPGIAFEMIESITNTVIYISLLFLFYRIMHYLLRFRLFERLIVYSSLTKYRFWRRYRAPKAQQKI